MLARVDGEEDWLPSEGWNEFIEDVKKYGNFIMGRETYELVTKLYPDYNFNDVDALYRVIVTTRDTFLQPEGYTVVNSPEEAVDFLRSKDIKTGLLIGGGKLNSSFYTRGLVDEVWVTVNPVILGQGRPFIAERDFEARLELIDIAKLSKSRVQLKYRAIRNS